MNEKDLQAIIKAKESAVRLGNYSLAADLRDLEKKMSQYIGRDFAERILKEIAP